MAGTFAMDWIFSGWGAVGRTVVVAAAMYLVAIAVVRLGGKRLLAKWNGFDSLITIAMGSSLATAVLSRQTSLVQGAVAFAALAAFQYALTWAAMRLRLVERAVKGTPVLLVVDGVVREEVMRRERVADDELRAAVRRHGIGELEEVGAVVLENDGSLSVLSRRARPAGEQWALQGLPNA